MKLFDCVKEVNENDKLSTFLMKYHASRVRALGVQATHFHLTYALEGGKWVHLTPRPFNPEEMGWVPVPVWRLWGAENLYFLPAT